jgi:protein SCO1/2
MNALVSSVAAIALLCAAAASAQGHVGSQPDRGADLTLSSVQYEIPNLQLVRQDGTSVSLRKEMDDGRPVVLNFIFTTCGSICPLMSQVFGEFQRKLGPESARVHLMSISIDPEQDTPERLREYAERFGAGPGWQHYTGTIAASLSAQQAFNVYRGDKMSHTPVTLLRAAPGQPWMRLDGFVTPAQLLHHYHQLLAAK